MLAHPLCDQFYRDRTPDLSRIEVPALVIANWGGLGLHTRGTIRGFMGLASKNKWLKVQGGSYFHTFLQPKNVALQKRFFDRYLKDEHNGWENEPPVEVQVRKDDGAVTGTSIMGLMMLGAAKGDTITISAVGDEAETVVATMCQLVEDKFGED